MITLDDVLNSPDFKTLVQSNFEKLDASNAFGAQQNILFSSEAAITAGNYIGGRYRWTGAVQLKSASIVCSAPVGADISFTLEVDGALTAGVLTVAAGTTSAELDLSALAAVAIGKYVRWKCTASPAFVNTAAQVHLTTNLNAAKS